MANSERWFIPYCDSNPTMGPASAIDIVECHAVRPGPTEEIRTWAKAAGIDPRFKWFKVPTTLGAVAVITSEKNNPEDSPPGIPDVYTLGTRSERSDAFSRIPLSTMGRFTLKLDESLL